MCEDENCGCHQSEHHQGHHQGHHHRHLKYSTIGKRTGDTVAIPGILLEVADIREGDFFKIYIEKITKHKKKH